MYMYVHVHMYMYTVQTTCYKLQNTWHNTWYRMIMIRDNDNDMNNAGIGMRRNQNEPVQNGAVSHRTEPWAWWRSLDVRRTCDLQRCLHSSSNERQNGVSVTSLCVNIQAIDAGIHIEADRYQLQAILASRRVGQAFAMRSWARDRRLLGNHFP